MSANRHFVVETIASCSPLEELAAALPRPGERRLLGGAVGSSGTAAAVALQRAEPERIFVLVASDPTTGDQIEADLASLLGEGEATRFPQRESLPFDGEDVHPEIRGRRVEAAEALFSGRVRIVLTTLRALQERTPMPEGLAGLRLSVQVGEEAGFQAFQDALEERGFERVPLVEEVGQYSVRGGIVDLFSFGASEPVRIEFWDDEVASIRRFDILNQRSIRAVEETHVLPVDLRLGGGTGGGEEEPRSLLELLPRDALIVSLHVEDEDKMLASTWERVRSLYEERRARTAVEASPEDLFLSPSDARKALAGFGRLDIREEEGGKLSLKTEPPPTIERDLDRLRALLREGTSRGLETLILCDNAGQMERMEEILEEVPPRVRIGVGSLAGGFVLPGSDPPLRVLTDHEIFRRRRRVRRSRRFRGAVSLERISQLSPGDYVVHLDHGIGRFRGLERIEIAGERVEGLAIEYADGEILRVPIYRLDRVERWVGETEEAEPPPVHRIGGKRWKNLRRKTEAAIETMTAELLELYARREAAEGHAYPEDTRWQKEMESSFLYEDTPDQRKATEEVKRDMESPRPMDRLVCGDVGYGKTEVAIRAAFKAVQDGKQVAVLAPTTILVEQHRHTFGERLADYPVRIRALSRFRTRKEQSEILEELARGTVDIVIGTHRLLQDDVEFHNLGLLVVDEEQRFGVAHKERLKRLRTSVDVLTLTATPIPRTLYLSLSGVRDLTVIRTPPRDRMPIQTHVLRWSPQILQEALHRELDRGGQAFFLHNRVETIHTAAERVRRLEPEARIDVAHGQMSSGDLDEVMRAFVDGEVEILVCTSIIENGLDVPNANTLIVDGADRFGLAQLYQIRGRVGRSDRRAYCYLVVPEGVTEEAERRLKVLEHYTELGSGYSVALRDLELRGAGNLLGADQSGFAHAVGLDTYMRLLEKTVERLKRTGEEPERPDPEVSLGGSAYLPDGYVPDSTQKLHLYRRISRIQRRSEVEELRGELEDRYGPIPDEASRLLDATVLRIQGRELGLRRILLRDREARLNFRSGVVPKMTHLEAPLQRRQLEVEVRRMDPLSLALKARGPEPLPDTVIRALDALVRQTGGEAAA